MVLRAAFFLVARVLAVVALALVAILAHGTSTCPSVGEGRPDRRGNACLDLTVGAASLCTTDHLLREDRADLTAEFHWCEDSAATLASATVAGLGAVRVLGPGGDHTIYWAWVRVARLDIVEVGAIHAAFANIDHYAAEAVLGPRGAVSYGAGMRARAETAPFTDLAIGRTLVHVALLLDHPTVLGGVPRVGVATSIIAVSLNVIARGACAPVVHRCRQWTILVVRPAVGWNLVSDLVAPKGCSLPMRGSARNDCGGNASMESDIVCVVLLGTARLAAGAPSCIQSTTTARYRFLGAVVLASEPLSVPRTVGVEVQVMAIKAPSVTDVRRVIPGRALMADINSGRFLVLAVRAMGAVRFCEGPGRAVTVLAGTAMSASNCTRRDLILAGRAVVTHSETPEHGGIFTLGAINASGLGLVGLVLALAALCAMRCG